MSSQRTWSLRHRFVVMAVLPALLASSLLALQANTYADKAELAQNVEDDLDQAIRLGAILDNLDSEASLATSIISIDELGFTPEQVKQYLDLDLWVLYAETQQAVDEELSQVDKTRVSPTVSALIERLPVTRTAVRDNSIADETVTDYYHQLILNIEHEADQLLEHSLTRLGSLGAESAAGAIIAVQQVNNLTHDSSQWLGKAYLDTFIPTGESSTELVGLAADLDLRADAINARWPQLADLPAWQAATVGSSAARADFLARSSDLSSGSIRELADLLNSIGPTERERVDGLVEVNLFLAEEARSALDNANTRAARGWRLAITASVTILVLLSLAVWRFVVRVNQAFATMEERANKLSAGDLSTDEALAAATADAPTEVIAVHTGMDALVEVLSTLSAQANALADGDLDAEVLTKSAGGALGQAFAGSIDRVRRTAQHLQDSEQLARTIIDEASDAIVIIDESGRIVRANPAAVEELGGQRLVDGNAADFVENWDKVTGPSAEVEIRTASGRTILALLSISQFSNDDDLLTLLVWRDITERKRHENQLHQLAHHDTLTGLLNRAGLFSNLEERVATGHKVTVIYLDLDGFKPFNDTYGHAVGDFVLQVVAERIVGCIRPDDSAARLGGDEFVVVVGTNGDPASVVAQRIVESVVEPIVLPSGDAGVLGISAGWASGQGVSVDVVLRHADTALYEAKNRNGNTVVAHDELSVEDVNGRTRRVEPTRVVDNR